MNGFLRQIRNKINKIIKLNNEIAHERIPNFFPLASQHWPPKGPFRSHNMHLHARESLPTNHYTRAISQKACASSVLGVSAILKTNMHFTRARSATATASSAATTTSPESTPILHT
jgi:hypothetical protein